MDQAKADEYHKGSMKLTIKSFFDIPTYSRLYDQHPHIQEFRIRSFLDDDNNCEKKEIIINDQIVFSTTSDLDGVDLVDAFDAAGSA
jgi:hypothetical protein